MTWSLYVAMTVLELTMWTRLASTQKIFPAFASPALGLKVYTTMPSQKYSSLTFPISQIFFTRCTIRFGVSGDALVLLNVPLFFLFPSTQHTPCDFPIPASGSQPPCTQPALPLLGGALCMPLLLQNNYAVNL